VVLADEEAGILHRGAEAWDPWLKKREPQTYAQPEGPTLLAKLATAMYFDDTLSTIRSLNRDIKVITILRHPVDRMLSLHRYAVQRGLESRPTEEALRSDIVERARAWRLRSYSGGSRYASAIDRVRRTFGEETLFLDYSEVQSTACLQRVHDFLGVPRCDLKPVRANESREPRSVTLARASASPLLQRIVKSAVPPPWRSSVKSRFTEWNSSRSLSKQPPISAEFRKELVRRHLHDILAAEDALARGLPSWRV
jgi:hypothetical protein